MGDREFSACFDLMLLVTLSIIFLDQLLAKCPNINVANSNGKSRSLILLLQTWDPLYFSGWSCAIGTDIFSIFYRTKKLANNFLSSPHKNFAKVKFLG